MGNDVWYRSAADRAKTGCRDGKFCVKLFEPKTRSICAAVLLLDDKRTDRSMEHSTLRGNRIALGGT